MNYLKQYEYLATIAEYRSFTIAAERLGIAQSALSRYVKRLEEEVGAQLLDRSSDPLSLTQSGIWFLETGRKMLALDQSLRLRIRDVQASERVTLRVGIGPSRAPYILPAILEHFRKRDGRTNLEIFELTTDEIRERLLKNELDIAISVCDADSAHIEQIRLFGERVLLCRNPKADCDRPILPGKGQLLREVMNRILAADPRYAGGYIEVQNTETAVALVKAGLGFTVVPSFFEEFSYGDGLQYSELPSSIVHNEREVSLLYRRDRSLREEELCLLQCAQQALGVY